MFIIILKNNLTQTPINEVGVVCRRIGEDQIVHYIKCEYNVTHNQKATCPDVYSLNGDPMVEGPGGLKPCRCGK